MIGLLIRKELLNNVFSFRFVITFVLLFVIVLATSVILTNDYVRKQDEFSRRQGEVENYLREYAHFNRIGNIIAPAQPPLAFYSLIRGISPEINMGEFNNDPLPVVFPLIDLTFIVSILLSLVALLFSYDSICGEKEDGTLKLMLSNSVSRAKVLLGKTIGGTVTLLIPFVFSLGISLLVILLNPRISWKGSDWGALGLIVFSTILYVTLFYSLGIFVSSRHKSGASSIMTSLFLWVLFILVIPSLTPYMASFLSKTPSRIQIGREAGRLGEVERDKLGNKLAQERRQQVIRKYPVLQEELTQEERQRRVAADPDYRIAYEELVNEKSAAWNEANRIQGDKMRLLWDELDRKEEWQTNLSIYLSMASPLSSFTYLTTDLSGTGMRSLQHFENLRKGWSAVNAEYQRNKQSELREQDPTMDVSNTAVDVSDMPRFQFRDEPLLDRIKGALPFFAALFIFNILFFTAAFVSFVRYDVR
jgi:ABC-type transport system involved in multi-copper enzyme maturation permease subunit